MMRYIPTDKYTVAWFKLAECVAKGEKEKAFGVYRLLMHSLDDKAYAYQLEGDLLGAFQDERALEKYEHAARLYVENKRWKEAIALYEELVIMSQDNARAVHCLLELYSTYKKPEQYAVNLIRIAYSLATCKKYGHIEQLIDMLPSQIASGQTVRMCTELCIYLVRNNELEPRVLEKIIQSTVSYATAQTNTPALAQFLSELEHLNAHWYHCAKAYVNSPEVK